MRKGDGEEWDRALEELNCNSVVVTGRFQRWVGRGIRNGTSPSTRFRFAQLSSDCPSKRVTSALLAAARDESEHFLVRGRCIESLAARGSWGKPKNRLDRKIYKVVLECLGHAHPNIRYWACFAASALDTGSLRHMLRGLMNDRSLGDTGWTVGYEAGEALKSIQGLPAWEQPPIPKKSPYPCPLSLG